MQKRELASLLLLFLFLEQPGWSCGRSCGGGSCRNNTTHGKFEQRSYDDLINSSQRNIAETRAIDKWSKFASKLESQKKWGEAEQSYRYVLGLVSFRDGPGSSASVPALEHLVKVTKAQKKLDQAVNFQETALRLTKAQPNANQQKVLSAQLSLADLLIQKKDYSNAEPVLKAAVAMCDAQTSLPQQKRNDAHQLYARVLRQLHKDPEADTAAVAATVNHLQPAFEKSVQSKQIIISQNAEGK